MPEAPLPPPPVNASVPFDPLHDVPADCILIDAILLENVIAELRTQLSWDDMFKSELESARKLELLFTIGMLIRPVAYAGCFILYRVVLVGAARNGSLSRATLFEE